MQTYKTGLNAIVRVNEKHLHVVFCAICNNQINYLNYGGWDYCHSKNHDCKKCLSPCTGLKNSYETGYESRTVHGYCKKCNTKIEYGG